MPVRLVAVDEGPDITLDRVMVVVGRHPSCDTRLDSLRVSRQHCCMSQDNGEVTVRDLGSTNGIRINGQRVERGRLRAGDELSIAHIRYRLENGHAHEQTIVEPEGQGWSEPTKTGRPRRRPPHLRGTSSRLETRAKMFLPRRYASCFPMGLPTNAGFKSSSRWPARMPQVRKSRLQSWPTAMPRSTRANVVPNSPAQEGNGTADLVVSARPLDRPASGLRHPPRLTENIAATLLRRHGL